MRISNRKLLAFMIAIIMLLPIITVSMVSSAAADDGKFVLDATTDLKTFASGAKKDGESDKVGTDDYFTLFYAAKTKIDTTKDKDYSDGYSPTQRINFQAATTIKSDSAIATIKFTATSKSTVKVWWQAGGNGREVAIYDSTGDIKQKSNAALDKNAFTLSEFTVDAGTYYIGNPDGANNYFKVEVTESDYKDPTQSVDWSTVATPEVVSATDVGGAIKINVNAMVGKHSNFKYADKVTVTVTNGTKTYTSSSVADKEDYECTISPTASGTYTVTATIERAGEQDKISAEYSVDYVLPLEKPYLSSATSKGNGKVELEYTEAPEAEKYVIYCNGEEKGETTKLSYVVTDLTVGETYTFYVMAVRGDDTAKSNTLSTVVTEKSLATWAFTYYGPSTNSANNGYNGDLNKDGKVTVYSEGGKGKIQPATVDGIAFYYTKIPTTQNFTLRATVSVDSWTYSNGQEGFGLLVTDRLGTAGSTSDFWNNQYMAGSTKIEYKYVSDEDGEGVAYDTSYAYGTKYSMKLGLGMISKTGITKDNLADISSGNTEVVNRDFVSNTTTLETWAGYYAMDAGTYNIVGNCTNANSIEELQKSFTTFVLEIQRNNTGYFIRYYDNDGKLIKEIKNYDPKALDQLDSEYVYAGFFASRNARATFSDVSFTTVSPENDSPAEEIPVTKIEPTLTVTSPSSTTDKEYTFLIDTNVDGIIRIKDSTTNKVLVDETAVSGGKRLQIPYTLANGYDQYEFTVEFTPDKDQDLGENTILSSTARVNSDVTVEYTPGNYHRKTVYISTTGDKWGNGSKENPFDIKTAIKNAVPGQTLILMEGTYEFDAGFKIERGNDGTEDAPIRLIADPEAATRPVLDFMNIGTGLTHGGNYWIFEGFDVTRSANGQKGFQISGNYNTLIDIHAYRNGNTGIQISRYSGTDYTIDMWPSYNLVLNCDSYYNMDAGHEDADGFAAKLTIGPGNVFDGCVAYNNADDGWDLYAKIETGKIGSVEIRNCVAYRNGYLENGEESKGNGNGFKMGGSSISGNHVLKNSVAFDNKAKGIDSNSCPDIEIYNSISFNNGSHNVALYTNVEQDTAFKAKGIIAFSTNGETPACKLSPKGNQTKSDYYNDTCYYWVGGKCVNASGATLDPASLFVSLTFDYSKGVQRNSDGTINLGDFLKLKSGESLPEGVGLTGASTASPEIRLVADEKHTYHTEWSYDENGQRHWHECECGDKIDVGEHDYVWVTDKEATETESGYKHRECTICGYSSVRVTIQPTGTNTPDNSEEPSGFAAILDMITSFITKIIDWFKELFAGFFENN